MDNAFKLMMTVLIGLFFFVLMINDKLLFIKIKRLEYSKIRVFKSIIIEFHINYERWSWYWCIKQL